MWFSESSRIRLVISSVMALSFVGLVAFSVFKTTDATPTIAPRVVSLLATPGVSRGYLTTPQELRAIAQKAALGVEPYKSAVEEVLKSADEEWDYKLDARETCKSARNPAWIHYQRGIRILYAKALAYPLTGNSDYAEEVRLILERIMTNVIIISLDEQQCRLNFGWGTPELVASADLIEDYWYNQSCTGPLGIRYEDTTIGVGNCKQLFQNWLVKNPYYIVSYAAEISQSNWGAAATTTLAYIADYLWDRPEVLLEHRYPVEFSSRWQDVTYSPAEAYAHANQLALDRMNGYRVDYGSYTCDDLAGPQQSDAWPPIKSQITELGIVTEDARREEYCNIPRYNGEYQNYPQVYIGNSIQQCELMLRRADRSCYDNIDFTDIANYTFTNESGESKVTHLYPGRGSLERAINSIIVDSNTEWRHDAALEVAYRYYSLYHQFEGVTQWAAQLDRPSGCSQDICFGTLTHGFAPDEIPALPPTIAQLDFVQKLVKN